MALVTVPCTQEQFLKNKFVRHNITRADVGHLNLNPHECLTDEER